MALPLVREHTNAIKSALTALGLTVGGGEAPDEDLPYVVVYQIPGGGSSGTLRDPDDDATLIYQVTCVGRSQEEAEWHADKALELLGGLSVSGRSIARVALDMYGGVQRDDQQTPPIFWAAPRFRIYSTPA